MPAFPCGLTFSIAISFSRTSSASLPPMISSRPSLRSRQRSASERKAEKMSHKQRGSAAKGRENESQATWQRSERQRKTGCCTLTVWPR